MQVFKLDEAVWGETGVKDWTAAKVHEWLRGGLLGACAKDMPFVRELGLESWLEDTGLKGSVEESSYLWDMGLVVQKLWVVYRGDWAKVLGWLEGAKKELRGNRPIDLMLSPLGRQYVGVAVDRLGS